MNQGTESLFACRLDDADLVRACGPEQPEEVKIGQRWMSVETGQSYPVRSVRDDVIQRGDRLVMLGSETYAIGMTESDLRARYVCTDAPDNVKEISDAAV